MLTVAVVKSQECSQPLHGAALTDAGKPLHSKRAVSQIASKLLTCLHFPQNYRFKQGRNKAADPGKTAGSAGNDYFLAQCGAINGQIH